MSEDEGKNKAQDFSDDCFDTETGEETATAEKQLYELRKKGRTEWRTPLTGWQKIKWGRDSR